MHARWRRIATAVHDAPAAVVAVGANLAVVTGAHTIRRASVSRRAAAVAFAALLALAVGAGSASAATTTVTCSSGNPTGTSSPGGYTLQQVFTNHVAAGDTVVIDGLCTGAFTLPTVHGGYTVEGAAGTTSGFNGENATHSGALLSGTIDNTSAAVATTIENLTFENALGTSGDNYSPAFILYFQSGTVTLSGDTFENSVADNDNSSPETVMVTGNGSNCSSPSGSVTIENSTFTGNTFNLSASIGIGGAGLALIDDCGSTSVSLSDDQFTHNTVAVAAASTTGLGGGLFAGSSNTTAPQLVQHGDLFDSNHVTTTSSASNFGGGGEWSQGLDIASTGDQFTNNSLPGSTDQWSWGAGLGVLNSACAPSGATTGSTLVDDDVAANTINDTGGDLPSDAQGAGIYLGALCGSRASHNNLVLQDSTVADNAVTPASSTGSPVAGIDAGTYDTLTLDNSILYGDTGGAETAGFNGTGSSLNATFSDFCNGTSPFTGTGNICASPMLVGGTDVHETAASPTIDAGSNSLVPAGLTTDLYGGPRELSGIINCTGLTGTVDIGAAEYAPVCPATLTLTSPTQTNAKWVLGSAQATIARKHHKRHKKHKKPPVYPVGTTFGFTLNAQAAVTLTFTESTTGRKVRGLCVAKTRKNHKKHKCTLTSTAGTLNFTGQPGANTVTFDGILQDGDTLKPGTYTVTITATTAGKTSTPAALNFTVAKS
jgi:hypothetical protein